MCLSVVNALVTIIDTPGLISAAPGKKNSALQVAARQVEAMVTQKMAQQEYIILCLEDSSDWNNATTRRTVMQASVVRSQTEYCTCCKVVHKPPDRATVYAQ